MLCVFLKRKSRWRSSKGNGRAELADIGLAVGGISVAKFESIVRKRLVFVCCVARNL